MLKIQVQKTFAQTLHSFQIPFPFSFSQETFSKQIIHTRIPSQKESQSFSDVQQEKAHWQQSMSCSSRLSINKAIAAYISIDQLTCRLDLTFCLDTGCCGNLGGGEWESNLLSFQLGTYFLGLQLAGQLQKFVENNTIACKYVQIR